MDNAITEIKNTLEGTNSRKTEVQERISEVEDTMVEINEENYLSEKNKRNTQDRLELKKYCPRCKKVTLHKEKTKK